MIQDSDLKIAAIDPLIGRILSHYTIQARLGEDEAGIIYQARDNQAAKEIIVKVLRAAVAADSVRIERYKRDLYRNRAPLRALRQELARRGHRLTEVRILDLLIWSVETAA